MDDNGLVVSSAKLSCWFDGWMTGRSIAMKRGCKALKLAEEIATAFRFHFLDQVTSVLTQMASGAVATPRCRPVAVDFSKRREMRDVIVGAVTETLSPMFALTNHGLEKDIAVMVNALVKASNGDVTSHFRTDVDSAASFVGTHDGEAPSCVSIEMHSFLSNQQVLEFHAKLSRIVEELLVVMLDLKDRDMLHEAVLKQKQSQIGGRESVRFYPKNGDGLLGEHIDMNMITLLWSNGPGLQVLSPNLKGIDPAAVRKVGIPCTTISTGAADPLATLDAKDWVSVDADWGKGVFLVTIGDEWFRTFVDPATAINTEELPDIPEIQSPVLHRVNRSLADYSSTDAAVEQQRRAAAASASEAAVVDTAAKAETDAEGWQFGPFWKECGRFSLPFLARLEDLPQDVNEQEVKP